MVGLAEGLLLVAWIVEDELAVDGVDDDCLVAVYLAFEQLAAHLVQYLALDDTFDGAGTHGGVEAYVGQVVYGFVGGRDGDFVLLKHLGHAAELYADDVAYLVFGEGLEHDDFVDTVEEFGTYALLEEFHDGLFGLVD